MSMRDVRILDLTAFKIKSFLKAVTLFYSASSSSPSSPSSDLGNIGCTFEADPVLESIEPVIENLA